MEQKKTRQTTIKLRIPTCLKCLRGWRSLVFAFRNLIVSVKYVSENTAHKTIKTYKLHCQRLFFFFLLHAFLQHCLIYCHPYKCNWFKNNLYKKYSLTFKVCRYYFQNFERIYSVIEELFIMGYLLFIFTTLTFKVCN